MDRKTYHNILELTKKLITIPSVTGENEQIDTVLQMAIEPIQNFPMETFVSNGVKSLLIRNTEKQTRDFTVLLNAHVDVVPGKIEQFTAYEHEGKLYGRGAYDMKAVVAIMVYLFHNLAKKLPFPIALQLATDEETGGQNSTRYQLEQGVRTQFALTGDTGSNLQLVNKAKGLYWIKLHAKGIAAHGGYPWRGENALWKVHHAVDALHKSFPTPTEAKWVTTMNLAKIETENTVYNNVPDQAVAYIDMRVIPEDEKTIQERVRSIIPEDIIIDEYMKDSAEYTPEENPFIQHLAKATQSVTKSKASFISTNAPSDIRHFNALGYPGVEFGVKGINQHADDEWLDIHSIEPYTKILQQFLLSIQH